MKRQNSVPSVFAKRLFQKTSLLMVLISAGGLVASPALGQAKPSDPAAAEALYLSGRKLVADGNWAEGCEKFVASMEMNPAASTLINIAKCHEHDGKLTQAIVDYRRALQLNQDTLGSDRKKALEQVAKEGIATLEPKIGRVTLSMTTKPEGLEIKRDGISLPLAMLGETIPLDPGKHVFEATAPGFRKETREFSLKEGELSSLELTLTPEAKTVIPDKPAVEKPVTPPIPDKPKPVEGGGGGVPTWAYVAGGLGLGAVGGGIFFKLQQAEAEENLLANCGAALVCDPAKPYRPDEDNAQKTQGFYLFVGLTAAGVVGITAAVVGIVSGTSAKKPQAKSWVVTPVVGRGQGGLVLGGAF